MGTNKDLRKPGGIKFANGNRRTRGLSAGAEGAIKPQHVVKRLYELTKDRDPIVSTDVGQHQMWTAQYFKLAKPNRWRTSGGLGTMGFGFPAAMGAQAAFQRPAGALRSR